MDTSEGIRSLVQITFREVTPKDATLLADLAVRAFTWDRETYASMPVLGAATEQQSRIGHGYYFAICLGNMIIGAIGGPVWDDTSRTIGPFFIEPELHGKGVGTKAVEFIQKRFPETPIWWVSTPHKSYRNHRFYEKVGFKKVKDLAPDANADVPEDFYLHLYRKVSTCQPSTEGDGLRPAL